MTECNRSLAVVTGASRGLGAMISKELAAAGIDVVMVGRDRDSLTESAAQAACVGASLHPLVCDLESADGVDTIVAATRERGGADILVNNAAIQGPIGPFWEIELADFERTLRVDFLLPVALAHAFLPGMLARRAGWIVNISGGGATAPRPMFTAYGAAKAALVRFGETLAVEAGPKGIRVNSIAPGAFSSGMTRAIADEGESAGPSERSSAERMLAADDCSNADKTAKLVTYLVAGAGRDVTGKIISAVWDPWPELHSRWNDVRDNDVYTLRRIVPADRKLMWGG